MRLDGERLYVDLLFPVSKKYANWDPEVTVEVGDWGRITNGSTRLAFWHKGRGTFLKEGNIYTDGKAVEHGIPPPTQFGAGATHGVSWIVSRNIAECDVDAIVGGYVLIATYYLDVSQFYSIDRRLPLYNARSRRVSKFRLAVELYL
jgi:hypothetical protein